MPTRTMYARVALPIFIVAAEALTQNFSEIKPRPQQVEGQDLEIGVLIHFGLNTFTDQEWGDGTVDPSKFNSRQLDPEQWLLAAKAAARRT